MTAPFRLPDTSTLTPEMRAQLTAASRVLLRGGQGMFRHEGRLHWGVGREAVRAFILARAFGLDPALAVAQAWYGETELGPGGEAHVRAMVARLRELEASASPRAAAAELRKIEQEEAEHA